MVESTLQQRNLVLRFLFPEWCPFGEIFCPWNSSKSHPKNVVPSSVFSPLPEALSRVSQSWSLGWVKGKCIFFPQVFPNWQNVSWGCLWPSFWPHCESLSDNEANTMQGGETVFFLERSWRLLSALPRHTSRFTSCIGSLICLDKLDLDLLFGPENLDSYGNQFGLPTEMNTDQIFSRRGSFMLWFVCRRHMGHSQKNAAHHQSFFFLNFLRFCCLEGEEAGFFSNRIFGGSMLTWRVLCHEPNSQANQRCQGYHCLGIIGSPQFHRGPNAFRASNINHPCNSTGLIRVFKSIWSWQSVCLSRMTCCLKFIFQQGL